MEFQMVLKLWKNQNGATLVQSYSGLIFEGPSMVRKINEEILELMAKDGYENISQAIGANLK